MAEFKKKDEELTTADLAGRSEKWPDRPRLVRNEERTGVPTTEGRQEMGHPDFVSEESASAHELSIRDIERGVRPSEPVTGGEASSGTAALFSESEVGNFRRSWSDIQAAFVDEPRRAVEDADHLVASLMKKLAEGFAEEREGLEKQWDRGDNISTEDLRLALQRYRSFFDRLLKV
jgi:hypothetical protein